MCLLLVILLIYLVFFENGGRDSCTEFKIKFEQTIDGETEVIADPRVYTIIDPGAPAQFNITWEPELVGTYDITITLDSGGDIEEFEEGDNVFSGEVIVRAHTPELTLMNFVILQLTLLIIGWMTFIQIMKLTLQHIFSMRIM